MTDCTEPRESAPFEHVVITIPKLIFTYGTQTLATLKDSLVHQSAPTHRVSSFAVSEALQISPDHARLVLDTLASILHSDSEPLVTAKPSEIDSVEVDVNDLILFLYAPSYKRLLPKGHKESAAVADVWPTTSAFDGTQTVAPIEDSLVHQSAPTHRVSSLAVSEALQISPDHARLVLDTLASILHSDCEPLVTAKPFEIDSVGVDVNDFILFLYIYKRLLAKGHKDSAAVADVWPTTSAFDVFLSALSTLQLVRSNGFIPSQVDEEAHRLSYLPKHLGNILSLSSEPVEGEGGESLVFGEHEVESGSFQVFGEDEVESGSSPIGSPGEIRFRDKPSDLIRRSKMEIFLFSTGPEMDHSSLFFVHSRNDGQVPLSLSPFEVVGHSSETGWALLVSQFRVLLFDGSSQTLQLPNLPQDLPPVEGDNTLMLGCFIMNENNTSVLIVRFEDARYHVFRHTTNIGEGFWRLDTVHQHSAPQGFHHDDLYVCWADTTNNHLTVIQNWQNLANFDTNSQAHNELVGTTMVSGIASDMHVVLLRGDDFFVYDLFMWEDLEGVFDVAFLILENWYNDGFNYYITRTLGGIRIRMDMGDGERSRIYVASVDGRSCEEVLINEVQADDVLMNAAQGPILQQHNQEIYVNLTNDPSCRALWFYCDIGRFVDQIPGGVVLTR